MLVMPDRQQPKFGYLATIGYVGPLHLMGMSKPAQVDDCYTVCVLGLTLLPR